MIKATSVSETSLCPPTSPPRTKSRWWTFFYLWSLHQHTWSGLHEEAMCYRLSIGIDFAGREPHLSIDVHSGRRWPEHFKHGECKPGTLCHVTLRKISSCFYDIDLLFIRLRRLWGLQVNPTCSLDCPTPVQVTWSNHLSLQTQECPYGASNQRNVSFSPELTSYIYNLYFKFWPLIFYFLFLALQCSPCGEVISLHTLRLRKMPGRRSWIFWRTTWGDEPGEGEIDSLW